MRNIKYIAIIIILSITITLPYILLKGYLRTKEIKGQSITLEKDLTKPLPKLDSIQETKEQRILKEMTPEQKVGQLFIFGIDDINLTKETNTFLTENHIGGILLLGKNITDEKQLKALIQNIQKEKDIPLFISIDQEGGVVSRIKWNEKLTIAQNEISNSKQAYTVAKDRGEILKDLGINMNLAPVVEYITDRNSFMYNRVYRGTINEVYEKGISSIQGYTDSGIIPVIKHFPGHSNTSPDSHYSLPIVNINTDQWNEYLQPFSKILEQSNVDAIMIGHIKFPNIDSNPATISKEIITNKLINDLKYNGLIISDDMEMDALENIDSYTNIAKQAITAGNDILIYSKYSKEHPTIQKDIYDYILNEVKSNGLNIDDKVLKILRMKIKYNIINN